MQFRIRKHLNIKKAVRACPFNNCESALFHQAKKSIRTYIWVGLGSTVAEPNLIRALCALGPSGQRQRRPLYDKQAHIGQNCFPYIRERARHILLQGYTPVSLLNACNDGQPTFFSPNKRMGPWCPVFNQKYSKSSFLLELIEMLVL